MKLNTIEELVEDVRQGRMVIVMDDEGRENEGDLILAASCVSADAINFMASHARGLICLTLTPERCRQLRLPLMVSDNRAAHSTMFTVSIEAARGVTTGISAADRATTVAAAVAPEARPDDLIQPGHVFPLMADRGGVLTRAGHTEAGCDLARLAGLEPAAVIVEILNSDGTMARRPDLERFARQHGLKIGTIEDLIRYRIQNERTVERVVEAEFPTRFGEFRLYAYEDTIHHALHLALVMGEVERHTPCPVRVHVHNLLCDTLGALHGCGWPLQDALQRIAELRGGVVVLLRQPEDESGLLRRIQQYQLSGGRPEAEPQEPPADYRTNGIGAQILADLGVGRMRLMSAPKVFHGLSGFNLEIVDYLS